MKGNEKKTSLAILSILAGVIYLLTIYPYFEAGLEGGIRNVKERHKIEADGVDNSAKGSRVLQRIQLVPKCKDILYSDSIVNLKSGKMIPVSYTKMYVNDESENPNSLLNILLNVIVFFGSLPFFIIPILFYKLIISFYKDQIFTLRNSKRIKTLAVLYLVLYIVRLGYNLTNYYIDKSTIELANYNIVTPDLGHNFLLIAILLFIVVIVMKRVMIMKEDQDLTI
jgi:hypothetical protein